MGSNAVLTMLSGVQRDDEVSLMNVDLLQDEGILEKLPALLGIDLHAVALSSRTAVHNVYPFLAVPQHASCNK
eukprot:219763-Amphidinium_carterae.1